MWAWPQNTEVEKSSIASAAKQQETRDREVSPHTLIIIYGDNIQGQQHV